MAIGITFIIIAVLIAAIWIIIEIKRLKHKLFAIFLIGLILLGYFSFNLSLREQDVDIKTVSGIIDASKIYFSWVGSAFGNMKLITTNAIKMDWGANETSVR